MKRISLTFQGHRQYRLGQVRLRVSDPGSWGASTHLQEMHFPCMRCKRDKTYPWLHPWKWKWQKINKLNFSLKLVVYLSSALRVWEKLAWLLLGKANVRVTKNTCCQCIVTKWNRRSRWGRMRALRHLAVLYRSTLWWIHGNKFLKDDISLGNVFFSHLTSWIY